jgi:predicted dehydrogenase
MADKPIKVRVAGCGQMGASHAKAYHAMPGFEIVGVVSRGAASSPTTTVSAAWSRRCFWTRS